MPEAATTETPPAPVQDFGKTPTLLETLSQQMDISGAPVTTARSLPPIAGDDDKGKADKEKEEADAKAAAEKKAKEKEKPEEQKSREEKEAAEQEEWKKASEKVADKLFKKRGPPKKDEGGDKGKPAAEAKVDADIPPVKREDKKPVVTERARKRASEAEILERAATAAERSATAAERAAAAAAEFQSAPAEKRATTKPPEDSLTPAERKQFDVYQELESSQSDRYKGVTQKYLKSLTEIADYTKTWAKENPGQKFDPDADEHNDFFERIEPEVDEDDWVDAKANLRAREISSKAVAPLNEKLAQMQKDQARAMAEPYVRQKQVESVGLLLTEFDPEIAAEINKPEGAKALSERDPITSGILNHVAGRMFGLSAEIIRLHDPNIGVEFDGKNDVHREIADFILEQEQRIAKLPAEDRLREGKRFIGRLAYRSLQPDEKAAYWFLDQDDVIYLLAQKYAKEAKKIRDAETQKFNATAEKLGYKKIEVPKTGADKGKPAAAQPAKPKESVTSPEALSKTSVKTTAGSDGKPAPDAADVIVGRLFGALRS